MLGLGGVVAEQEGELTAEAHFACSLALREETGDRWGAALMRLNLADIAAARGDTGGARSLIETGLATWRILGYQQGIGRALFMLAQLDEERGDLTAARSRYHESLAVWRAVGYRAGVAEAVACVGWLMLGDGDQGAAAVLFGESLAIWREMGSRRGLASSLVIPIAHEGVGYSAGSCARVSAIHVQPVKRRSRGGSAARRASSRSTAAIFSSSVA